MAKTVLITRASGGLGLEFARIYARRKCDFVLVARSEGKLYAIKNQFETEYGIKANVYATDLSVVDAALDVFNYTLEKNLSEAVAEKVKGTGITVTALCPGPTATGFEKAAGIKSGSNMFNRAASAAEVTIAGVKAVEGGKALMYPGGFVKLISVGEHLLPRKITRKYARRMNY